MHTDTHTTTTTTNTHTQHTHTHAQTHTHNLIPFHSHTHMLRFQRPLKQSEEGSQTDAVHIVDLGQVGDDEVECAPALGQWDVAVALHVERGLKTHTFSQGLADGDAGRLGLVEGVQQFLVLQDVACGVGKLLKHTERASVVWIVLFIVIVVAVFVLCVCVCV